MHVVKKKRLTTCIFLFILSKVDVKTNYFTEVE